MKYFKMRTILATLGGAVLVLMVVCSLAVAAPNVSDVTVTDVTTVSFSVIWASDEASTSDLSVFEDEEGTLPVADITIESQPVESGDASIVAAAETMGVMKVRVSGLMPDTTYYFQTVTTSKSGGGTTLEPLSAPMHGVTTEIGVVRSRIVGSNEVPFSNDLIRQEYYLPDGVTEGKGALLVADVAGGNFPVSRFAGDGIGGTYAYVDLNNIFSSADYQTKPLDGGEILTLTKFMGKNGIESGAYVVPPNNQLVEMKAPRSTVSSCVGDFDTDGDVDGDDFAELVQNMSLMDLSDFAAEFGRNDCI